MKKKIHSREKVKLYFRQQDISVTKMRLLYCRERLKRVGEYANIRGVKADGTEGELLLNKEMVSWIVEAIEKQEKEMIKSEVMIHRLQDSSACLFVEYDSLGNIIIDTKG